MVARAIGRPVLADDQFGSGIQSSKCCFGPHHPTNGTTTPLTRSSEGKYRTWFISIHLTFISVCLSFPPTPSVARSLLAPHRRPALLRPAPPCSAHHGPHLPFPPSSFPLAPHFLSQHVGESIQHPGQRCLLPRLAHLSTAALLHRLRPDQRCAPTRSRGYRPPL